MSFMRVDFFLCVPSAPSPGGGRNGNLLQILPRAVLARSLVRATGQTVTAKRRWKDTVVP